MTNPGNRRWGWVLFVALTAGLRLFHLEYRGFWTDEFRTLHSIRLPLGDLVAERLSYGHFPTYFALLKIWAAVCGDAEWSLRLPSVLCVAAAAAFVFLAARRAWGASVACWAASCFALHGRGIWAAQEARPYGLLLLAASASFYALIVALDGDGGAARSRRTAGVHWGLYAFWSALGLVSHATYLLVFAGQAVVVAAWLGKRRSLRRDWLVTTLGLALFAGAAYGWLGHHAAGHIDKDFSDEARGLSFALFREGVLEVFWGEDRLWSGALYRICGLALAAGLVAVAWKGARRLGAAAAAGTRAPVFALAAAWAFSIVLVMATVSALKQDIVKDPRYFSPGLGGACLLLGLGIGSVRRPRLRWGVGAAVLGLLSLNAAGWLWNPFEQVREAVRYVAERRAEGEPVFICKDSNSALIAEYYRLGAPLNGFVREEQDRGVLRRQLERSVGAAPGFWLILYKPEKSPILDVIAEWTASRAQGKYGQVQDKRFAKVAVKHWRKP